MAIKTLHLTNAYHPTSGGIRTFYRALLTRANDEQREMRLVVPAEHDSVEEVGRCGRIYAVKARFAPAFDRRYRMLFPDAYLPAASSRLRLILDREQPDVVEICDKYSLFYLAAMLRKAWMPTVKRPTLVGLSFERMDDNVAAYLTSAPAAHAATRRYLRHLYGPPFDFHVANSEYTADELRRALWDRAPGFIRVSPMGVDFQAFGPVHRDPFLRRSLLSGGGGGPESVLLMYAGRVSPEKNVGLLIDMMERLQQPGVQPARDYRLAIIGDGPRASALMADAARRVPGRVSWLGALQDRSLLARHLASADVFVHPNPREPFGIGPLEAMASRVPVVVPSAGGVLTYASTGNAWLAAADGESFALAVRAAATSPDQARLAAARETARAFDWPVVTAAYFRLYDALHAARLKEFAFPTTVSHRNVKELGHPTLGDI